MRKIFFSLPILVWIAVFYQYLIGQDAMTRHGIDYYHIIKYFMDNRLHGAFPLWDPFWMMGRPDSLDLRFIGEYNPFLWLYPFFNFIGLSPTLSFMYYAFTYHFIGLVGFYLLAKKFFDDADWAYLSFLGLLYSSLIIPIFVNYCINLLFVPLIWLFYFLYAFFKEPNRKYLLGLTFATMILAITYLPFYFLTIFLTISIVYLLLFFKEFVQILKRIFKFLTSNKILACFCLASIIASLIPGLIWFLENSSGDFVFLFRKGHTDDPHSASMAFEILSLGTIVGPVTIRGLFSGLESSTQLMFYVSFFFYIVLLISIVNKINRKAILLFVSYIFIFLITLTNMTPILRFLFDHVFYFKYIRNLFYLIYLAYPLLILFSIEQLRVFITNRPETKGRQFALILFVIVIHLLFGAFLMKMGRIIITSYITLFLSLTFFIVYLSGWIKSNKLAVTVCLMGLIILQPAEVFYHYVRNGPGVVEWFPHKSFTPKFFYVRPLQTEEGPIYMGKIDKNGFSMDGSGFYERKFSGLRWVNDLHTNIKRTVLENYTQYKFYLYDDVEYVPKDEFDFSMMENLLKQQKNKALLFDEPASKEFVPSFSDNRKAQWYPVMENTKKFQVLAFNTTMLKIATYYSFDKLLVYNDAYHSAWQVKVNNQPQRVLKANYAFKGVWLPKGTNTVEFRYGTPLYRIFNRFMVFLFIFVLIFLVYVGLKDRTQNEIS